MRAVLALGLVLGIGCAPSRRLEVLGVVPEFQLTAQDGSAFDSKTLDGHVWVANFIFTTCNGPCPMMSSQMLRVQSQTDPDVKLVSFTVDPDHDTPAVLAEYGKRFKYDPKRWWFLTGDAASLTAVGRDGFHMNAVDGSTTHSTRFALVDRKRRIRGYYSTAEEGFLAKLVQDIRALQNETT